MFDLKSGLKYTGIAGAGFGLGYIMNELRNNRKFRLGIFGGSALLFTVYTTMTRLGPEGFLYLDKKDQRSYELESKKIKYDYMRDSLKNIYEKKKAEQQTLIDQYNNSLEQKLNEKINPLLEEQEALKSKIDSLNSSKNLLNQGSKTSSSDIYSDSHDYAVDSRNYNISRNEDIARNEDMTRRYPGGSFQDDGRRYYDMILRARFYDRGPYPNMNFRANTHIPINTRRFPISAGPNMINNFGPKYSRPFYANGRMRW